MQCWHAPMIQNETAVKQWLIHFIHNIAQSKTVILQKKVTGVLKKYSFLAMVHWMQYCTNFNLLNLMLHFVLLFRFHCSSSFKTFKHSFCFFCCKHCKQFSFIQCCSYCFVVFNILFLFMTLCLLLADSVYYANRLIGLIKDHIKYWNCCDLISLAHKSWFLKFKKKDKA